MQWVGYAPDQSTWEPEENLHKNEVARYLKSVQLPPLSGELFVATFREHVYRHLKPKKAASWYVEFYIEELRHPALALCVMNAIRGDVPLAHVTCSQRDKTTLTLRAGSTGMDSLGHALRFEAIRPEQALGAARLFFGPSSNTDVHVLWCLEVEYSQPAVAGGGDAARLPTQPNAYSFVVRFSTAVINGFNGGLTTLAPSGADAKGEKNGADLRPGKAECAAIIAYAKRVVAEPYTTAGRPRHKLAKTWAQLPPSKLILTDAQARAESGEANERKRRRS